MANEKEPVCPNSKCKKSEFAIFDVAAKEIVRTQILRRFESKCSVCIVFCTSCGKIIGLVSV